MTIAEAVKRYLEIAGEFGRAAPLDSFGLSKSQIESVFAAWDEDYQINRFMLLTLEAGESQGIGERATYRVNGFDCTHVTFQPGIQELL